MKPVYLDYISLLGPGLDSWEEALPILDGAQTYQARPAASATTGLLPANERRRLTATIKLALQVAEQSLLGSAIDPGTLHAVFASCAGDSDITDRLCRALALAERPVSPVHFHNSVHNAPAGYWAIAVASRAASTSVAAGEGSFAAGLLEAATQVLVERVPVLLVAYDSQPPATLAAASGIETGFGVSLLLMPQAGTNTRVELQLALSPDAPETHCVADMEALRLSNPAARALPLLAAIARGQGEAVLPHLGQSRLGVMVRPC